MPEYIDLRGHQLYNYEWDNDGEAVVLLHGGLSQTSHWDYTIVPQLEDDFHIFAYDRTGHGYTGDQPGSFHFDFQMKEAIAYLEDVVKEPAHLIGWSDGGIIALLVAIARPDLVKSIVAIGANFHPSGTSIDIPVELAGEEDQAEYNLTSPDAPHTLNEKIAKMVGIWKSEPSITKEDLQKIQCPVLVLVGDDDVISHSHSVELYESLPLGQLAVIPGTSHGVPKEKPGLFSAIVAHFLEDLSYPITKMPIRRKNPEVN
jgi:pimeloyl-ACP methyl ester carboxylesterase